MIFMLFLIIILILLYALSTIIKPYNYPPGPPWLPIIGNALLLKKLSIRFNGDHEAFINLSKKYNTNVLGLKLGQEKYVIVFGKSLIEQVFVKEELQGRPDNFFIRLRTLGSRKGITMTDGYLWSRQRPFAEKTLASLGLSKRFMENILLEKVIMVLEELGDEQHDILIQDKISLSFTKIVWRLIRGEQSAEDDDKLNEILNIIKERSRSFSIAGGILNMFPWIRFIAPVYTGYSLIESLNTKLNFLFQGIIKEHKQHLPLEAEDFIAAYLLYRSKHGKNEPSFTDDQLVGVCLDLLLAGSLPTSYTLNFAILTVAEYHETQYKIQKEIDDVLQFNELPTLSHKSKLPYTQAVLMESTRLHHVVPTSGPRRVLKDTIIDGYNIPKDTTVLLSVRSIHYDENLWDDPQAFRPERFLDENGNFKPYEGLYRYSIGRRRCPGEALANNFVFLFFTALCQRYKIEVQSYASSIPRAGILLNPPEHRLTLISRNK